MTTEHRVADGSILFTDLVGFTAFTEEQGDAAAVEVLERQSELVADVLGAGSDGRVVKELGDGLMLWFSAAADAMAASLRLLGAVRSEHDGGNLPLSVRMGLHHGEAVERSGDLIGNAVNVAARVAELAGPGELLVSQEVLDAMAGNGPTVELVALGPVSVKGVRRPVWLYRTRSD